MDLDVYVAVHAGEWRRLEHLLGRASRPSRCSGAELDELVGLYQRAATHLSVIRSASPDPQLLATLSELVARGRSTVAGSPTGRSRSAAVRRFVQVDFPAAVYRSRRWSLVCALASIAVAVAMTLWIGSHPEVRRQLVPSEAARGAIASQVRDYYSDHPAQDFAAQVWTNNARATAAALVLGLLILPTIYVLYANAANAGVDGGFMVAAGRGGEFLGLILPHGLLELTCVFVGAGAGLRLGWRLVAPGALPRGQALAAEARSAVTIAVGLVGVLLVSGILEAFVTPAPFPTWLRVTIGAVVWVTFLTYVGVYGGRAARAGETGDLPADLRGDVLPTA